jgi:hypothetical protein
VHYTRETIHDRLKGANILLLETGKCIVGGYMKLKLFFAVVLLVICITLEIACIPESSLTYSPSTSLVITNEPMTSRSTVPNSVRLVLEIPQLRTPNSLTSIEMKEKQILRFKLSPGDRVEGQVTTDGGHNVLSTIYDPYSNVAIESSRIVESFTYNGLPNHNTIGHRTVGTQVYPWKFAFIASTEGEYYLYIYTTTSYGDGKPRVASATVTIFSR